MEANPIEMWRQSAGAWIADQGEEGDASRRIILDPALERFRSTLEGKRVLDLGCGEGRYARKMNAAGALVTGVDPVPEFIERARHLDPAGDYRVCHAEDLPLEANSFDVVLSYLTLMDVEDYAKAGREMVRVLAPGGRILLVLISNLASCSEGWIKDAEGNRLFRPVDRYMEEFSMNLEWRGIRIVNYHRPLSAILKVFFSQGCVLTDFIEPLPPADHPWHAEEHRAPNFQILELMKLPLVRAS